MADKKAITNLPPYRWRDAPDEPPRHKRMVRRDRFLRQYGIMIALAAAFTIYTILLSSLVYFRAEKKFTTLHESQMAEQRELWEREYTAEHFLLTGEASRKAAMEQDAIALAHDGGVWKTEEAFKAYCWNAVVRSKRVDYPNSIPDVLAQTGQYAFHSPGGAYEEKKFNWAMEVLEQAYADMLPAYLTLDHQFLEMRDGGADCILHTNWQFYTGNDDPWRVRL